MGRTIYFVARGLYITVWAHHGVPHCASIAVGYSMVNTKWKIMVLLDAMVSLSWCTEGPWGVSCALSIINGPWTVTQECLFFLCCRAPVWVGKILSHQICSLLVEYLALFVRLLPVRFSARVRLQNSVLPVVRLLKSQNDLCGSAQSANSDVVELHARTSTAVYVLSANNNTW